MTGVDQVPPGWYGDPTGRHGQRWWDGQAWSDHVADGQAVASDPVPETHQAATTRSEAASTAQTEAAPGSGHRSDLERAVLGSDGGSAPKGWPDRYEAVIASVLAVLEAGEPIHGAWRMRTTGPRQRVSDVGLIVVTDRKVIGADQSAKTSGIFVVASQEIASVALVHRRSGTSDFGWEIRLLGNDGTLLGTEDSPAELQVFAKGRDPSKWDSHPQGEDDLAEVQQALLRLLPTASPSKSEVDVTATEPEQAIAADPRVHPPPATTGAPLPPPPTEPTLAGATDAQPASGEGKMATLPR